jgi:hypothetical protein
VISIQISDQQCLSVTTICRGIKYVKIPVYSIKFRLGNSRNNTVYTSIPA